ncbi:hypothetical protein EMIT053CA3_200001 [Pseudomonas donghuensis]
MPAIEREAVAIQTTRYVQAGLASSLASQLPQVLHHLWGTANPVGAGLAGDRARSGRNPDDALCASRAGLIAGKPAPTGLAPTLGPLPILWEPDLPAIEREAVVIQTPRYVQAGPASSLASQLPQVLHRPWAHCQSCGSRTCRRSSA